MTLMRLSASFANCGNTSRDRADQESPGRRQKSPSREMFSHGTWRPLEAWRTAARTRLNTSSTLSPGRSISRTNGLLRQASRIARLMRALADSILPSTSETSTDWSSISSSYRMSALAGMRTLRPFTCTPWPAK